MTTIEQSSFTRLLEAAELVRSGFPFNCYGDLKELHQAVEAARSDRALYEATHALLEACERASDTFRETAIALRLLGHETVANAMDIAEADTRTAIALATPQL